MKKTLKSTKLILFLFFFKFITNAIVAEMDRRTSAERNYVGSSPADGLCSIDVVATYQPSKLISRVQSPYAAPK